MNEAQQAIEEQSGDESANFWAMVLHLSTLAVFVIPIAGVVMPIVIWQIKKDTYPVIDRHGKMVTNWLISSFIYWVVSLFLAFIVIGFLLMFVLAVLFVVFAIVGGLKAQEGVLWEYPLTIKILK